MNTTLSLLALAALATGCASNATDSMRKDVDGNYASTSRYDAMDREDFTAAMEAGLLDFDDRLASLESQAQALGPDAIEEYYEHLDGLMHGRREFAAELEQQSSLLAADWQDSRDEVADSYVNLREDLDEAYADVVDEA